jgi:hypothetical protein
VCTRPLVALPIFSLVVLSCSVSIKQALPSVPEAGPIYTNALDFSLILPFLLMCLFCTDSRSQR